MTVKISKTRNLAIALIAFFFALLSPGTLLGAAIPSIKDVVEGKAKLPTIEDLTDGKVKIGDMINKNNVELVKDYLTVGMYELVKKGMVLRMGTQLPPDQLYPKSFQEATERNRGKAVMDKTGAVYYEKIGTLWPGGIPFPWSKSGLESMGNFNYGRAFDSLRSYPSVFSLINSKGEVYKTAIFDSRYVT
ncbi:MAG: DUF1329 domain-containing protein [Syntrophales bacterium]